MQETEKEQEKNEKPRSWLKNPFTILTILIFVFAIILRFHYFLLTLHQPVWWDESEYLSAAKSYAGIVPFQISSSRLPGYPLFLSLFFKVGLSNEVFLRFIVNFLPSLLAILLVFLCVKEMYPDKRIALISALIVSVLWEHLFYSNRFHTENFALIFELLAFFVLFRVYLKGKNLAFIKPKYSLVWILAFSLLSVFFRPGNLLFVPPMALFILLVNKSRVFTKKTALFWAIAAIAFIAFLFVSPKIPRASILSYYNPELPLAWNSLGVFHGFYESLVSWIPSLFYYAFFLGLLVIFYEFFLYWPKIKKLSSNSEDLEVKSDIFGILVLVFVLAGFIFIIRSPSYEYRWFFPLLVPMLAFTGKGVISFSDHIGSFFKSKNFSATIIILLVLLGAYTQVVHADSIIKLKLDSYSQIRDASLWIKENSNPGDIVLSRSFPQTTYYSEREVYNFAGMNESRFLELVSQTKPKYLLESALEPNLPEWSLNPPESIKNLLLSVKIWFLDSQQTQPVLIVYAVNQTAINNF